MRYRVTRTHARWTRLRRRVKTAHDQPWRERLTQLSRSLRAVQKELVVIAAVAAAAECAHILGLSEAIAAITTVLTLRVSVHASLNGALAQMGGTLFGVAVALGAEHTWSSDKPILLGVAAGTAMLITRALRLGTEASVTSTISTLVVLSAGTQASTIEARLWATAIGAGTAVTFAWFAHPATPAERADEAARELAGEAARLLDAIAEGTLRPSLHQAGEYLTQARELSSQVEEVKAQAAEAVAYAQWSPTVSSAEAGRVWERAVAVEHTIVQVRTIARTLYDLAEAGGIAPELAAAMSEAIEIASEAVATDAQLVTTGDEHLPAGDRRDEIVEPLRDATEALTDALVDTDDPSSHEIIAVGAAAAAVGRIAASVSRDTGAIPLDEPAAEPATLTRGKKVLKRAKRRRKRTRTR